MECAFIMENTLNNLSKYNFFEDDNIVTDSKENSNDKYFVPIQDFSELQKNKLKTFDEKAWSAGQGYEANNMPVWNEKMEGLRPGFYIFAGYSNAGKTAVCINIAYQYAMNPDNHLNFLYFTLDDTRQLVIPRMISMIKGIPVSVCALPERYQNKINAGEAGSAKLAEYIQKRGEGLKELMDKSSKIMIQDSSDVECAEKMLNFALAYKSWLQVSDPEANLIIVIDSLMDVNIDQGRDRDEKERNTRISRMMKDWADNKLKCPIFGTAHLKKNPMTKRPSISDLKESGRYEYDATAVFMVMNDVSRNGQNATIYYNKPNSTDKSPVIEIQWAKNKASSFKERLYYYFSPEYSKIVECTEQVMEQYNQIIYS